MFSVNSLLCNANGPHTATAVFLDSLIKVNYKVKFLVVFSSELRNLFQWTKLSVIFGSNKACIRNLLCTQVFLFLVPLASVSCSGLTDTSHHSYQVTRFFIDE